MRKLSLIIIAAALISCQKKKPTKMYREVRTKQIIYFKLSDTTLTDTSYHSRLEEIK